MFGKYEIIALEFSSALQKKKQPKTKINPLLCLSEVLAAGCRDNRWEFRTVPL